MPAVNWDQPSTGIVNDVKPSLRLANKTGRALIAQSVNVAVEAISRDHQAVIALTDTAVTGEFFSVHSSALFGDAPNAIGVIGGNQNGKLPAVGGASLKDPSTTTNTGGFGVLGASDRFAATGVAGVTLGPRSVGVAGRAQGGGVGVSGVGSLSGVEGRSDESFGVSGFTTAERSSAGVLGAGSGLSAGVRGESLAGPGVDAHSSAGPGVQAVSDQADGVIGKAQTANAVGVFGQNDNASGIGIDGESNNGIAVRGFSTNGTAVHAETLFGIAVDASTISLSQPAMKVFAALTTAVDAASIGGIGVSAVGNTGVLGGSITPPSSSDPKVGAGVFGAGFSGSGVCGITLTGSGVLGIGKPGLGALAGEFRGDVFVKGTLFKFASLFSIDHPLDPKRKTLNHAAVESDEYKTFYDGAVSLDSKGQARIRLPRWFEALNTGLRYQLTALGAAAPQLHVAKELRGGTFVIAGGRPRQRVCWQLTGTRRDTWAKANPLQVEKPKSASQQTDAAPSDSQIRRIGADLKRRAAELVAERAAIARKARMRRRPKLISGTRKSASVIANGRVGQRAAEAIETIRALIKKRPSVE
jgi:hypothetical protein